MTCSAVPQSPQWIVVCTSSRWLSELTELGKPKQHQPSWGPFPSEDEARRFAATLNPDANPILSLLYAVPRRIEGRVA